MTVFVTGASGHLGGNLVRALVERGARVRVLLRKGSNNEAVDGLEVERVFGDLSRQDRLEQALDGCERLFHLAAFVSIRDADKPLLFETNVLGTRRLMAAAKRVGVSKVVHCSSFGTIGHNPDGPSDESWVASPFEVALDYERSKVFGEYEVLRAAVAGLDATIVNPSGMIGPWDCKPSMVGRAILDFARGKLHAYVPGGHDFVPMRDVVAGHLAAMERGARGERHLLTGEYVTMDQIFGWLSQFVGRPPPRIRIPAGVAVRVARAKDFFERNILPGRHPRFNRASLRLLQIGKRGDNTKARQQLGVVPTSLRDAFAEQVKWFRDQGRLP